MTDPHPILTAASHLPDLAHLRSSLHLVPRMVVAPEVAARCRTAAGDPLPEETCWIEFEGRFGVLRIAKKGWSAFDLNGVLDRESATQVMPMLCGLATLLRQRPPNLVIAAAPKPKAPRVGFLARRAAQIVVRRISLSEPTIVHSAPVERGKPDEVKHRCEHYVPGYWRTSRSGKRQWVEGFRRGDPSVSRKTPPKVWRVEI